MMADKKIVRRKGHLHIHYIPRPLSVSKHKVKPYRPEEKVHLETNNNGLAINNTSQKLSEISTLFPSDLGSKGTEIPSNISSKIYSSDITNRNSMNKGWFHRLTSKPKWLLKLFIIMLAIVVCIAAAVVIPVYFFVLRYTSSEASFTNFTASICSSTCIGKETPYQTSMLTVLYPFDGNANSLDSSTSGALFGTSLPTYTGNSYIGTQAIAFTAGYQQYVQIPYLNLAQSFTIEMWVNPNSVTVPIDYGIFCQCDSNLICLSLNFRNVRFVFSLDSMNTNNNSITGTSVLSGSDWTHVTIVYDAVLFEQRIYVNGQIDAISRGMVAPYQGTSSGAVTTIGRSLTLVSGTAYFAGRINQFSVSLGVVRTDCQIYNDATLIAYYPFDTTGTYNDYSVNLFNGVGVNTVTLSPGRIGQAIYFPSNTSYFQAQCFTTVKIQYQAFSISLWVNPANATGGGSLIHISTLQGGNGTICYDLLAFTSTGALVLQWPQVGSPVNASLGGIIPANKWTHIAVVYGIVNGIRLFINEQLSTESQNYANLNLQDPGYTMFVTLGTNSPVGLATSTACPSGSIPFLPGQFIGAVDEFRFYNRELDSHEICRLADM